MLCIVTLKVNGWCRESTEAQAFSKILDETCEEEVTNPTAMLSDQQTFGDVLEKQYQHDNSEWWNDPTIVAHLADSSLKKVMYRHPETGVLHASVNSVFIRGENDIIHGHIPREGISRPIYL